MTNDSQEQENLVEQLLDESRNLWVAPEFVEHLRNVLQRLPISALQKLVERDPVFFAPGQVFGGRALDVGVSLTSGQPLVYLSPELPSQPREEVEFVIAQELAHVMLGHRESPSENARAEALQGEVDADKLAESWGFRKPLKYRRPK